MKPLGTGTNTITEINDMLNEYFAWRSTTPINGTLELDIVHPFDTSKMFTPVWSKIINWFVPELVLDKLYDIYLDCSFENWDGYQAIPINETTYREAEALIRALPSYVPAPDILPEPDGGIGIDWVKGEGYSFTISVSRKNVLAYAGLFGENNETFGTEVFTGTLPKAILHNLERLFSATE